MLVLRICSFSPLPSYLPSLFLPVFADVTVGRQEQLPFKSWYSHYHCKNDHHWVPPYPKFVCFFVFCPNPDVSGLWSRRETEWQSESQAGKHLPTRASPNLILSPLHSVPPTCGYFWLPRAATNMPFSGAQQSLISVVPLVRWEETRP